MRPRKLIAIFINPYLRQGAPREFLGASAKRVKIILREKFWLCEAAWCQQHQQG
jgi:hypothetical protein